MTSIIVQGVIFLPFRQFIGDWAEKIHTIKAGNAAQRSDRTHRSLVEWFNELINCAQCTGFWCGLFCGLFLLTSGTYWLEGFGIQRVEVWTPLSDGSILNRHDEFRFDCVNIVNRLLMWFCCGVGGSFLASVGCNFIDWGFYRKMNALRQLEEQDIMLEKLRENDKNLSDLTEAGQ
jgi:hypothetical protein